MKLLPKKSIDSAKAVERKKEIDDGLALARKVDQLRQSKIDEEADLLRYRESAFKIIQSEIAILLEEKESLKSQNEQAMQLRNERLKPLTIEWENLDSAKSKFYLGVEKNKSFEDELNNKSEQIEKDRQEVTKLVKKSRSNEEETEKIKLQQISLRDMAQREYETAKAEHDTQTNLAEKKLIELQQRITEYEVATVTANREIKQAKEKEAELIIREQDVERRIKRLQKYDSLPANN